MQTNGSDSGRIVRVAAMAVGTGMAAVMVTVAKRTARAAVMVATARAIVTAAAGTTKTMATTLNTGKKMQRQRQRQQ